MDPETFVHWAEEYFGKYKKMVKKEVLRKIADWIPEELLALREEALRKIETQYKTAPDVYFIHHSEAQYERDSKRQQIERERRQIEEAKERQLLIEAREQRRMESIDRMPPHKRDAKIDAMVPNEAEKFFKAMTKKMKDKEKS